MGLGGVTDVMDADVATAATGTQQALMETEVAAPAMQAGHPLSGLAEPKKLTATYFPVQTAPPPRCPKCAELCDPIRAKLVKKATDPFAYKCRGCNTKHVQL